MKKRTLSFILALVMLLTLVPATAFAEIPTAETQIQQPSYEAETPIGTLLMHTLENDENTGSFPGSVTDLAVEGTTVRVELIIDRPAELVVAVYPDSDTDLRMLTSGSTLINAGRQTAAVRLDGSLPEYFIAAAYLLDPESYEPLSETFISRYYTAEFQAFLETTTEDYEQELVVNLDGDESSNFLVFEEDVLRFTETPGVNDLTENGDGTYTIRNADARFKALRAGDAFAYTYADESMLIVVVDSVQTDGDTVIVTENREATLEMVFAYIKIDTCSIPGEGTVDMSGVEDNLRLESIGPTFLNSYAPTDNPYYQNELEALDNASYEIEGGMIGMSGEVTSYTLLADPIDVTAGTSFTFSLDGMGGYTQDSKPIVRGNLILGATAAVKVYRSADWFSTTVKLDCSVELNAELGAKLEKKFPMGEPTLPLGVSGMKVSIPFYIDIKVEGKLTVSRKWEMTLGGSYDSDVGFTNLTSWPSLVGDSALELEASGFIGIEMDVEVSALIRRLLSTKVEAKIGFELTAKQAGSAGNIFEKASDSKRHDCLLCIQGDLKVRGTVKIKFEALFGIVDGERTVLDIKAKLADFYWSRDPRYGEFGWGMTCPHISYRIDAELVDRNANKLTGVELFCNGESLGLTDQNGRLSFYRPNGPYTITAQRNTSYYFTVKDSEMRLRILIGESAVQGQTQEPLPGVAPQSGTCGDNLTWRLYSDGTLVIEGQGEMYNYKTYSAPWPRAKIRSVVIRGGVTGIGEDAFSGCSSLASIYLPDSVTNIGNYAFKRCSSLASISIPDRVTSIGGSAFHSCTSLTSIAIPGSVTSIGLYAFSGCSNLTSISIPDKVTYIDNGVFQDCSSLTSITIPDSVTYIDNGVFRGCSSLTNITIPDSVTYIGNGVFNGCSSLTSIIIPDGVTSIGEGAFCTCTSLTSIHIPGSVTSIGELAFWRCRSLTSIYLPDSVTIISEGAFNGCSSLASIYLPVGVTSISNRTFYECSSLTDVYYAGTKAQWKSITIVGAYNTPLTSATIHYNSSGALANMADYTAAPLTAKPVAAYSGELSEQNGLRLASFSGLKPGAAYALLVTADENAVNLLAPANLLYIAQGTADEDGHLTLAYVPRLETVGAVRVYGPSALDLKEAEIVVEQYSTGLCRVAVLYEGALLRENLDYRLTVTEEGTSFTAAITGLGAYSGAQTARGEKLAVTIRLETGKGAPVRRAKLLGQDLVLPALTWEGQSLAGWSTDSAAQTPDYLPGARYTQDADAVFYAVWALPVPDCVLPASLRVIGDEAFSGCGFVCVQLGEGMQAIGALAFADSSALRTVYIPQSVTKIADNAFQGVEALTVCGVPSSTAETFAQSHGFSFVPTD